MPENWQINWVDYYRVLQVHMTAEPEVIKAAYEKLARKYHPDLNTTPAALDHMKELNEAYEVLGNLEKRKRYHTEYLLRKNFASAPAGSVSLPKPEINPPSIVFNNASPGQSYRGAFVIKNTGGPYSRVDIEHASSWLRILHETPASGADRLPLEVEVEVQGQEGINKYIENLIVKLDEVETHVRIELKTAKNSTRSSYADRTVPGPFFPCVLLVDTSEGSGTGLLEEFNAGLEILRNSLRDDPVAGRTVELALITCDSSVMIRHGLVSVDEFKVPVLSAAKGSSMGTGINKALDIIEYRTFQYRSSRVEYYRPWLFMVAAGGSKGDAGGKFQEAARRIAEAESENRLAFFAVGADGAAMGVAREISVREPVRLADSSKMFRWLAQNLSNICRTKPGEKNPLQPIDWGIF